MAPHDDDKGNDKKIIAPQEGDDIIHQENFDLASD